MAVVYRAVRLKSSHAEGACICQGGTPKCRSIYRTMPLLRSSDGTVLVVAFLGLKIRLMWVKLGYVTRGHVSPLPCSMDCVPITRRQMAQGTCRPVSKPYRNITSVG